MPISTGLRSTRPQAAAVRAAGRMPLGSVSQTQAALTRLSAAIATKAMRQPRWPPISAPIGRPSTRGHRPAEEDEGDGAAALLGRHQQAGAGGGLGREDRGRDHREHAHRQQGAEAGHEGAEQVADGIPEHREGQQPAPVPARDRSGQQRGAQANDDGARGDQLARGGGADGQRRADLVERARHHHDAGADHEIAGQQRPKCAPGRRLLDVHEFTGGPAARRDSRCSWGCP